MFVTYVISMLTKISVTIFSAILFRCGQGLTFVGNVLRYDTQLTTYKKKPALSATDICLCSAEVSLLPNNNNNNNNIAIPSDKNVI
jgi:hypothetical protein